MKHNKFKIFISPFLMLLMTTSTAFASDGKIHPYGDGKPHPKSCNLEPKYCEKDKEGE